VDWSWAGLASRPCPAADPTGIIQDCCGLLDALATPIGRLEREIATLAKPDPRLQALMALPGVGKLTAMTLVAEIGDIGRFPTARKLCAWAGLTPQVRNSDRKVRHGHITKQGSPWVRGILPGGRPDGQAPPHVRRRLRRAGPAPGPQHRHRGHRPAAAGPLLSHPDPDGGSIGTGEGWYRARSRFRMSLQDGRPA
jgi:transposase